MKKYLTTLMAACCMLAAFSMPASALEYHFDGPDAGLFGRPTSDDTIYVTMDKNANTDRSKNAAYIPPAFGSPTSYTLNAGELLTPNLVSGSVTGTTSGTGGVTVLPPSTSGSITGGAIGTNTPVKHTAVTEDLYYRDGSLGTLNIPAIGLSVRVYQGTDADALRKGAGSFKRAFEPVLKMIEKADSLEQLRELMEDDAAVAELYAAMDVSEVEELLQKVMLYADLEGRVVEDG